MAQLSKRRVNHQVAEKMFSLLSKAISSSKNEQEARELLVGILTDTERVILAKRLAIAMMLSKGYRYQDIQELLKVSPSTVNKVREWLTYKGRGVVRVLNKITDKQTEETFWQGLTDALGGMMGSRVFQEKSILKKIDGEW